MQLERRLAARQTFDKSDVVGRFEFVGQFSRPHARPPLGEEGVERGAPRLRGFGALVVNRPQRFEPPRFRPPLLSRLGRKVRTGPVLVVPGQPRGEGETRTFRAAEGGKRVWPSSPGERLIGKLQPIKPRKAQNFAEKRPRVLSGPTFRIAEQPHLIVRHPAADELRDAPRPETPQDERHQRRRLPVLLARDGDQRRSAGVKGFAPGAARSDRSGTGSRSQTLPAPAKSRAPHQNRRRFRRGSKAPAKSCGRREAGRRQREGRRKSGAKDPRKRGLHFSVKARALIQNNATPLTSASGVGEGATNP